MNSVIDLARPEIVAMKPYSSARREAAARGILLNANESPWPLVGETTNDLDTLNRYPQPQHAGLAEKMASAYGLPADHLLITRGSDDGIDLLARVFCRAGVDSVLDTPPGFGMYRIAAQIQGAGIVDIARKPETLELDEPAILEALEAETPPRLAFFTSPANPTGDLVDPAFMEQALKITKGRTIVVVDEAYAEFTQADGAASLIASNPHLVVLRTLSKAYASAGLRCGAVLAQPQVIDLLMRVIPPYPLATPVLGLALELFEPEVMQQQQAFLNKIAANKSRLLEILEGRRFVERIWPGHANFVLLRVHDSAALVRHCANRGITIRAFPAAPLLQNCVRISVGSADELQALEQALADFE